MTTKTMMTVTMMTVNLTKAQWAAVREALAQFTENERCNDSYDSEFDSEHLLAAEQVLETLEAPLVALAEKEAEKERALVAWNLG